MSELRLLLTAVQYFTRIPVPTWVGHSAEQLDGATRYFPLVGLLVGALAAAVLAGAAQLLPWEIAVLLSMLTTVVITGAFHEDGLADSADGLYGGWTVQDRLRIMKDSRVGTYGVLALLLILSIKWATLVALRWPLAVGALLVGQAVSRCCAVWVMRCLPYVREDESSRAKPIAKQVSKTSLVVGCLCAALPTAALAFYGGLLAGAALAITAAALTTWLMIRLLRNKLGGYTGDGLGATQQLTEVACYLALLTALSNS